MILLEKRASTVLYHLLQSLPRRGAFLLPANICPIVPLTLLKAGRPFELLDISPQTLCLDENLCMTKISADPQRYAGVIWARTYGTSASPERLFKQLRDLNADLLLIDDKCLAPPEFALAADGSADVNLYSTGYAKYLDIGWGGYALVRADTRYAAETLPFDPGALPALAEDYKQAISKQLRYRYTDSDWLITGQPECGPAQYRRAVESRMPAVTQRKAAINSIYSHGLPDSIQLPSKFQHWRFNIHVPHRDELLRQINKQQLFASCHYASLGGIFSAEHAENATILQRNVINLFNDFYFSEEQATQVVEIVRHHCERFGDKLIRQDKG